MERAARNLAKHKPELPPSRRRYDDDKPEKLHTDLRSYMLVKGYDFLPAPSRFPYDYFNLSYAMRKRGYWTVCEEMGLEPDPDFYIEPKNLEDEIDRIFLDPQRIGHEDDDDFEVVLPSYEELKSFPALYEGVRKVGGMIRLFPTDNRFFTKLSAAYYRSDENLKEEALLWMKLLRINTLPTFAQIEPKNQLLPTAYLARGGYLRTAELLGLPAQATYLKDLKNLEWELNLVFIAESLKNKEPVDPDTGLPDWGGHYIPTESEIRKAKRSDIHKAIESHGGYYEVAQKMYVSLHTRFWEGNPSLRQEMKRAAYLLNHPRIMPDKDELKEIGRTDLARAIDQNGGYKDCAAYVRLEPKKRVRRNERALVAVQKETKAFLPYPFRRFDPQMALTHNNQQFGFEVPTDVEKGEPEQFGVWLVDGNSTKGRLGRVRRRARSTNEWLYRSEGESTWSGAFSDLSLRECIDKLLEPLGGSEQV